MKAGRVLLASAIVLCSVLALISWRGGVRNQPPSRSVAENSRLAKPVLPASFVKGPRIDLPRDPGTNPVGQKTDDPAPSRQPEQPAATSSKEKPPAQDPVAREALAYVGFNEEAEQYWAAAINDPNLPPQERQDLIEDLNEDGISDPKHPSLEDLPVILNRLQLIEAMAPEAMDQVNADAFMEAYKDLVNLAYVAVGGGEPVR